MISRDESAHGLIVVNGFDFKMKNMMAAILLRLPIFGQLFGRLFLPRIREMFEGFKIRDRYIDELIQDKKIELQKCDFQITDG